VGVMPKEVFITDNPNQDGKTWMFDLRWGRNNYVQAATYKAEPLDALSGADAVWIDFDREGINRLIRTLRKARDQAYGSDA
jgi:hypothetical protein